MSGRHPDADAAQVLRRVLAMDPAQRRALLAALAREVISAEQERSRWRHLKREGA